MEILTMRFHDRNKESPEISDSLIAVMRDVLTMYTFDGKLTEKGNHDNDLADIAAICLNGKEGIAAATQVAQKLADSIKTQRIHEFDYPKLLKAWQRRSRSCSLDAFLAGDDDVEEVQRRRLFFHQLKRYGNPLNQISDDEVLSWCEINSAIRYQIVAAAIAPLCSHLKQAN